MELGVPPCILEDQHGFILHREVLSQGDDANYAVPMVETSQERFSVLHAVSFDRCFHSPENRFRLGELLDHNVLPKRGYSTRPGGSASGAKNSSRCVVNMRR